MSPSDSPLSVEFALAHYLGVQVARSGGTTVALRRTALSRYHGAVATIQIREIPEDAYEVIRKRARASGRSIQSFMREVVVEFASRPTTEETLAMMESARSAADTPGATHESIVSDLAADRR